MEEPGLGPAGSGSGVSGDAWQLLPLCDGHVLRHAHPGGRGGDPPLLGRHHRRDLLRQHHPRHRALCGLQRSSCTRFLYC